MPALKHCSACGAEVSDAAQDGLCVPCLLGLGLPDVTAAREAAAEGPALPGSLKASPDNNGGVTSRAGVARRFGDYELLEEIARGGMGVVCRARQVSLDRIVAIKLLHFSPLSGPEHVMRFRAEASAAASLQHPNIVAVHEVGVQGDQHYLVMDFVDGCSLRELTARQSLPSRRAAAYLKTIAEAVQYAHERGILHRDLKPANVLIDSSDQPRVADFGLAKRLEGGTELTVTGEALGSPGYMPPEQAVGRRGLASRRSDVYGLGATLYHLLTDRPPFVGETVPDTLAQVLNADPIRPRLLNPSVPADLEVICLKCLEKDGARRYPTAQALADELGRFLRDEPIHARPISRLAKAWRWCRRKPAIAFFAGATALLLLVVAIGAPISAVRISRERAAAERNAQAEMRERTRAEHNLYAAEMNLAQEALNEHNLGRAWQLLERWDPATTTPGGASSQSFTKPKDAADSRRSRVVPDLRGWEWRYMRSRCRGDELATLTDFGSKHSGNVVSVAFSPDGRWLASGSHDGKVKIFDVAERREEAELVHRAEVRAVAFSPREPILATLCLDNVLRLWDMKTRLPIAEIPAHTTSYGSAIAYSADGSRLAYCDPVNGWVTVTNFVDQSSSRVESFQDGYITRLAFSPDGRTLARRDWGSEIKFFDLSSGQEMHSVRHIFWANSTIAFSPDGGKLVSTSLDRTARIWDSATGQLLHTFTSPISHPCAALFLSDGKTLAIANAAHTITLWGLELEKERATLKGHQSDVLALAVSLDGALLASGSADGEVKLWSTTPRIEATPTFPIPREVEKDLNVPLPRDPYHKSFTISPDGRIFAVIRHDGAVEIWNSATLTRKTMLRLEPVLTLGISSDGKRLASGSGSPNRFVKIWRLDADPPREESSFQPAVGRIDHLEFSPGGTMLAVVGRSIELRHVEQGKHAHSLTMEGLYKLAFSPNGGLVAAGGVRRNVKLWDVASGQVKWEITAHEGEVAGLMFFPDGRKLVTGSTDRTTKLWDVESGRHLATLEGLMQGATAVAVSPDGKRVAAGSGEGTVRLWKVDGAEPQEVALLHCLGSLVNPIAFLPDGNTIVARSFGGVQLWQAPSFAELTAGKQWNRGTR